MSKPYTEADFTAQITEDRNWRIREISDLKTAISRGDTGTRKVLLRALIAIGYAHWEGYVRFSARKYLEHVALRRLQFDVLDRQFFRNYFLPRLAALATSKSSLKERCTLVDEILGSGQQSFKRVNPDLVNTRANLSSEVLADICLVCGVRPEVFADDSTFIDVILLKRRNAVAHGEDTLIAIAEMDEIADGTIGLMRKFGDALENHVVLATVTEG